MIAERDLQLRGPGDFFGTRQSGLPQLRAGDLTRDADLLERAFDEARARVDAGTLSAAAAGLCAGRVAAAVRPDHGWLTRRPLTCWPGPACESSPARNKGRTLKAPKWDGLRPTSDKLRETLFNILQPRVRRRARAGRFAGTGAVALEALSRGAARRRVHRERSSRRGPDRRESPRLRRRRTAVLSSATTRGARCRGRFPAARSTSCSWIRRMTTRISSRAASAAAMQRAADGIVILEHASRRHAAATGAASTLTRTVTRATAR